MKAYRLNRLFHPASGRCFAVALDQTAADSHEVAQTIETLAEIGVDALRLTLEQAELLQRIPGRQRPALILRADVTNAFTPTHADRLFCRTIGNIVDHALRLDAAAIAAYFIAWPDHPELRQQCRRNLEDLSAECDRRCLPLIVDFHGQIDAENPPPSAGDLITVASPTTSNQPQLQRISPADELPPEPSTFAGLMVEQLSPFSISSLDQTRHRLSEYHRLARNDG